MIEDMYVETQFSVFMVNKPGVLSQVLGEIAKEKLNILAMTMMDSAEHGVMRIVTGQGQKTEDLLEGLNLQFSKTQVLCLKLMNKTGALAYATEKLAKGHVNISYAYCTSGAKGGKATGVLKVADVKKAMKILKDSSVKAARSTRGTVRKIPK